MLLLLYAVQAHEAGSRFTGDCSTASSILSVMRVTLFEPLERLDKQKSFTAKLPELQNAPQTYIDYINITTKLVGAVAPRRKDGDCAN